MLGLPGKIVVFDMECTAWEGSMQRWWSGPGEHIETVQIAAALIETKMDKFTELKAFEILIKPERNPILSDYFINLTGITQERVDREGVSFPAALQEFHKWCASHKLYSFSKEENFDRDVLIENCDFCGIELLFDYSRFFNMREVFEEFGIPAKQYSSGTIVEAFGKKITRSAHSAINDVRTLVDGLRELSKLKQSKNKKR